jgi:urea transporter
MRTAAFYISFVLVLLTIISLVSINSDKFGTLSYFMTFLWGAADGGTSVLLGKIAGT